MGANVLRYVDDISDSSDIWIHGLIAQPLAIPLTVLSKPGEQTIEYRLDRDLNIPSIGYRDSAVGEAV